MLVIMLISDVDPIGNMSVNFLDFAQYEIVALRINPQ